MVRLLILLALSSIIAQSALAREPWSTETKVAFGIYAALVYADWRQTKQIAKDGVEGNPALGRAPSQRDVDSYILAAVVASALLVELVPTPWRNRYLYVAIGVEGEAVTSNWLAGFKF